MLRGKFIGINAYIKQQERPQIGILSLHLKEVEKEEQAKSKANRKNEIIKIRLEIKEN